MNPENDEAIAFKLPENIQKKLTYILESKNNGLSTKYKDCLIPFEPSLFPLNVKQLYPRYLSYLLELGSGWGEFALEYAQKNPDHLYIALDKKKYRIKKSAKEQTRMNIPNLRWMVCNLEWVFNGLFEKESFDKIFINFPDPWPKSRHQKHRFVGPELIAELTSITKSGGILEFATDSWLYMQDVLPVFERSLNWKNKYGDGVILPALAGRPVSFFENLKRSEKENIYIIVLEKL
ncbi:MAG: methyltransferase domain-containing protein [Spirochaetia bacterium]|nr:methyltransferase domain-containing protein [Spirochaetia bacterium]